MTIPVPDLDDRRFQDLVDDAKRAVMRRCPEWTDHNVSDPGVTLIETFAQMTDELIYRLNRVPPRLHVKFLELIGLRLLPPAPARAAVTFWLSTHARSTLTIPAGTAVSTVHTEAGEPVVFTTEAGLDIVPAELSLVCSSLADAGEVLPHTDSLALGLPARAFAETPRPGDALLIGLAAPVPGCAVRLDLECHIDGIGVDPRHPPLVWEATTAQGWLECRHTADETGGLNRSGVVTVHVPTGHDIHLIDGHRAAWLRARVTEPEPGRPPYSVSPIVHRLGLCTIGGTVNALHATVIEEEELGDSEGVPAQRFPLSHGPVLGGIDTPAVDVASDDGWTRWRCVEHFADSLPDDRHFVLDRSAGEVVFGPVVRLAGGGTRQYGAVPPHGRAIRIRRYAVGGGASGNVHAGALCALRSSIPFVAAVDNLEPARGGVDGETLEEAMARAPILIRTRGRAVTAEDYEALAREAAPGVARVRCVPVEREAPGAVRVLIVPAAAVDHGRVRLADLEPDPATLGRIAHSLEQTRVVGARVVVEPPFYRGITVVATLIARPRVDRDRVERDALDALYGYLCPLAPGGPEGGGWPFGRAVRSGDLFAVLQRVRGVDVVEDLRLFGANPVTGQRGREVRRLELEAASLVFSYEHLIRVVES